MRNNFNKWLNSIKKELKAHPVNYLILGLVLILALFIRIYRVGDLLGFYFDQGRDAMVIWRLWHEGKPFLIGPVTGLAGIFLGPFYYYLIAPFYLISKGDPVLPAVFLAFLATCAIYVLYYLGWKVHSRTTGLIAAIIASFSYYIVLSGRWLANPTPILLTSILLLWFMWEIVNSKSKAAGPDHRLIEPQDLGKGLWPGGWWIGIALLIGISLQFQAASAVFYLPMIFIFAIWQHKKLPDKKTLLIASAIFLATLLPQIAFNFRHENILFNNFKRVLIEEKSFRPNFWDVLGTRIDYFWTVFSSKIFPGWEELVAVFAWIAAGVLVAQKKRVVKNKILPLLSIYIGIPMLGFLVFQGNFGNIYDYYMTGYYLPMILFFSLGLGELWRTKSGKFIVLVFFGLFLVRNGEFVKNYLRAGVDGPEHITLGNELQALNWVFDDAEKHLCPSDECSRQFNVDVYVPPVIPHSYDYLFLWRGTRRCGEDLCGMNTTDQVPLLYTLYEIDPPHPWRLEAWLNRQKGIGQVEEEEKFGGITVQRRRRL